jgi:two-component system, NarL family, response regulator LiaR
MESEKIRVVLVDDHVLFREGTRELLDRVDDIEVVGEASNGDEAIQLAAQLSPDVVIIDIEMPGMSGVDATRQIKEAHPEFKILALTVHDEGPYVFAALEAGAAGYLLKDVRATDLIEAVRALHRGESVLHPTVAHQVLQQIRNDDGNGVAGSSSPSLTDGERAVLGLAAHGMKNREIATELGIHPRTVQLRLSSIFKKLEVGSRTEAVLRAVKDGVFSLDELTS